MQHKQVLLENKQRAAEGITQKYALLSREYTNQNKMLNENHVAIVDEEKKKRTQIAENFENHIKTVTDKIDDDNEGENEVVKETRELEEKYQSIKKEIDEKSVAMDEEIKKKEEGASALEQQISSTIQEKKVDMVSQQEQYEKAIEMKKKEEEDLLNILTDYKEKYGSMDKALGKSRQSFKQYEKQIKQLEASIQAHRNEKAKFLQKSQQQKKKKKGQQKAEEKEVNWQEMLQKMSADWQAEKAALEAERDQVKADCGVIQELIKKQESVEA